MAKKLYPEEAVQAIADAIRSKNGSSDLYKIGEMAEAIEDIPSGGDFDIVGLIDESITSAIIPEGTTKIGKYTFCGRTSLASIQIPDSVTSIGAYAFDSCGLTTVTVPRNVTNIGYAAFQYCSLQNIIVKAIKPPTLGSLAFYGLPSSFNIYVPAESVDAYKSASNWSSYASNIQAIPE